MKTSTTDRQPPRGKIQKITTGSGNVTTGRSGLRTSFKKQRELPVEKIRLPVDIVENKTLPDS